ncbi:MAG: 2-C-methyl-D-erythritol 2,4-cyclodiphosphate synthase, partial [Acidimicrobiia bacterium]|nr:2-C-methyl-D-erythritol 2,4-cyclodiphosphate synthase [Acidimicrobiia bacterium]
LLGQVVKMCSELQVDFVDVTVIAQDVRVAPHRAAIRENLAAALGLDPDAVSVKATTTDGMGAIGAGEGIAVTAVVTAS